ncbi:MAG: pantoate--beta-alanine ligase [Deltaproteobacteria bacterium]
MDIIADPHALKRRLRAQEGRIGFVPTMGALHAGHLSLIDEAKARSDFVVASIFVNPKQFGPNEDLDRYPRDLDGDAELLAERGCDLVFAPTADVVYPPGFSTLVRVDHVTEGLCGAHRPGHFDGVTTIVLCLFEIVRPDVAVFGEKDYQQLATIRTMARDLFLDVEIVGAPIVREPDGLAMSSRNRYLSADEHHRALALHRALFAARDQRRETADKPALLATARTILTAAGVAPEYLELRDATTLAEVEDASGPTVMLVAARVGATRLIDNVRIDP